MSEPVKKGSLGQILYASRIISEADLEAALAEQQHTGCRIGEALVRLGIVAQEDIDWALSNQLDLPYIRLKRDMIDPEALALVPGELARRHTIIPLIKAGGELNIAMADPLDKGAVEAVQAHTGLSVNISVALIREIRELLDACYGIVSSDSLGFASAAFSPSVLAAINSDLSGQKLLDYLLVFMLRNRLSSLSLHPAGETVQVQGRSGGVMRAIGTLAPGHYGDFTGLVRARTSLPVGGPSSGTFSLTLRNRSYTFQVALLQGQGGELVTFRPRAAAPPAARLADLNLPPHQQQGLARLAAAVRGITFFASSLVQERCQMMALMLGERNLTTRKTIVLGATGCSPAQALTVPLPETDAERARLIIDALEHDPDVLVIEDISGGLPFTAACRAAMTGVLVLAGLQAGSSAAALEYLLQCRRQNYFLPLFVNGLVVSRQVQLLCQACRTPYQPPAEELAAMGLSQAPPVCYQPAGCEVCGQSGNSELRLLLDVLLFDGEFRRAFEQAGDVAALEQYLAGRGHHGLAEEGLRLLMAGEVSPEEYLGAIKI